MGPRTRTESSIISTARLTPKQKPISLARIICMSLLAEGVNVTGLPGDVLIIALMAGGQQGCNLLHDAARSFLRGLGVDACRFLQPKWPADGQGDCAAPEEPQEHPRYVHPTAAGDGDGQYVDVVA